MADANNNRLLRYSDPTTNGQGASLVLGQPSFTSYTAAVSQTGMGIPEGVALDQSGNVWVADGSNYRVLEYPEATSNCSTNLLIFCGVGNFLNQNYPLNVGCPPICTIPQGSYEISMTVTNPEISQLQLVATNPSNSPQASASPFGSPSDPIDASCTNLVCGPFPVTLTPGSWTLQFTPVVVGTSFQNPPSVTLSVTVTSSFPTPEFPFGFSASTARTIGRGLCVHVDRGTKEKRLLEQTQ